MHEFIETHQFGPRRAQRMKSSISKTANPTIPQAVAPVNSVEFASGFSSWASAGSVAASANNNATPIVDNRRIILPRMNSADIRRLRLYYSR